MKNSNKNYTGQIDWEDLDKELSDMDIFDTALLDNLTKLPKKSPGPGFVTAAMERWDAQYMPLESHGRNREPLEKLTWRHMITVATQRTRFAIIFGAILYAIAFLWIFSASGDDSLTIIAASSIPFIFGMLFTLFQWRAGMMELIKSCRIPMSKVLTARVFMLFVVNCAVNVIAAMMMTNELGQGTDMFVRMTLLWCAPFFLTVSACVLLCTFVRSFSAMMACVGMLPFIAFALIAIKPIQEFWVGQHTMALLAESVVCLAAVIVSFKLLSYFVDRKVIDYGIYAE